MLILGIDPGYDRLGVALVEKNSLGKETLIFSDCFVSNRDNPLSQRLLELGNRLEYLIKEYSPQEIATEKLFFSVNQKTALQVAEARGLISYLSAKNNLPIYEYSPADIKMTVCGFGNANKKQIAEMVPRLIKIDKIIQFDDEYDAIAIALTHLAVRRGI